jgi:hypothetical protein
MNEWMGLKNLNLLSLMMRVLNKIILSPKKIPYIINKKQYNLNNNRNIKNQALI